MCSDKVQQQYFEERSFTCDMEFFWRLRNAQTQQLRMPSNDKGSVLGQTGRIDRLVGLRNSLVRTLSIETRAPWLL